MKALAYQPMAQKRRTASALASRIAKRVESHSMGSSVICTGLGGTVGFNWNTGATSSGGVPQVAGG